MGMNISLYSDPREGRFVEHPTWDWMRHAGDRDIPEIIESMDHETINVASDEYDCIWHSRPKDPDEFEAAALERFGEMNADRWRELAQAFRDGYWAYFSY